MAMMEEALLTSTQQIIHIPTSEDFDCGVALTCTFDGTTIPLN